MAPHTPPFASFLDRIFCLRQRGTTPRTEVVAGLATFMTMAYILFVNPAILAGAGMPKPAVVAATCLAAAVPTLLMGLWANYPLALASGMGLNAAVVLHAAQTGASWQTMMGVIVLEGLLVTVLVLTRVREQVMLAIPLNLKRAISVGIGLFIAFLGLQHMGWVTAGKDGVLLHHGAFTAKPTVLATVGLVLTAVLLAHRVRGALLFGILGTTVAAALADRFVPSSAPLVNLPNQWFATPDFSTFGQADLLSALHPSLIAVVFAFLITDFFDTLGTVIGIGGQAGFLDAQGRLPRLNRVLLVDSLAAVWGGACGASSSTTYIESAAGVSEGGRTGLVAVTVASLFLLALFCSPLIQAVPPIATAPALLIVGFLMMSVIREMDLTSAEEGLPAFLTLVLIPLTQSIATGIGMGFISTSLLTLLRGRVRSCSIWIHAIAAIFAASFICSTL